MQGVTWIVWLVALLFFTAGALCVFAVVIQLPGAWILLALAVLIELIDGIYLPPEDDVTFGVPVLLTCLGLALVGELLEFLAAAIGLQKGGGTRRGLWGSILGGIAGVFLLTPLFVFVPFFGAFLGVLLGTFLGALIGELSHQRRDQSALRPALWAAAGRLAGTTGKVALATAMWGILTVSAFLR